MNLSGSGDVIYAYTGSDKDSPVTPFLGAIATDADLYNQPDGTEGTLENTDLTQAGNETILLPDNIDNAQYIADRSGNTPNGYRIELNIINGEDATDDNWNIFNGGNIAPFPPFDDTNFVIVNPPTIAFTTSSLTVSESVTSVDLTIKLVESSGDAVDVDVAFLPASSEADNNDITYSSPQTVNFTAGANSGDTQIVTVNIDSDTSVEGDEIAVFQLQNISPGSIISPDVLNLTITDDDAPDVVINEFLADPAAGPAPSGDANGDGTRDSGDDEFMEIVNNSTSDIDITGWQLSDNGGSNITHTFPSGTVLPANQAIVVFGGGEPAGNFGGAIIQTAGDLSFTNGGGNATLLDDSGSVIQDIAYGGTGEPDAGNNQSVTRNPDITGNFEEHTSADSGDDSSPFSPGTRIDGTAFGSATYAIAFRGSEGYRFVSTPTQNTSFSDLFADFWTQGITGSDAPSEDINISRWQEPAGGTFDGVTSMSNDLTPGRGYIIYVFEDDDFRSPGVQGGFPKVVNTNNDENSSPVDVAVTSNDNNGNIDGNEGFNLLGNPYGTDVSVTAVIDALEAVNSNVNANIYVWDHEAGSGNGGYEDLTDDDQLAPFQAYFMRYTVDGVNSTASFVRSDLAANQGTEFFKGSNQVLEFKMYLGDGDKFDTYKINFSENGTIGEDRYDAYKLFSLKSNAIGFYSTVGQDVKLAKNALPTIKSLEGELRIPLTADVPTSGEYTFSWSDLQEIPEDVELYLVDKETNREINIRTTDEFTFNTVVNNKKEVQARKETPSPFKSNNRAKAVESRFELLVVSSQAQENEPDESEQRIKLSPNYPNPFNNQTTMDITLPEDMHVTMEVYNIVGQKVGTMMDENMSEGPHSISWNAPANMPSGIYICKMEAGSTVMTRKMTLVK
jgi:hypothetical protein